MLLLLPLSLSRSVAGCNLCYRRLHTALHTHIRLCSGHNRSASTLERARVATLQSVWLNNKLAIEHKLMQHSPSPQASPISSAYCSFFGAGAAKCTGFVWNFGRVTPVACPGNSCHWCIRIDIFPNSPPNLAASHPDIRGMVPTPRNFHTSLSHRPV